MRRVAVPPRHNWQARLLEHGFDFHTLTTDDGHPDPYWIEDACYEFSVGQIDELESATQELHDLCLDAVGEIIDRGDYESFGLNQSEANLIERSWSLGERGLYGRMDLSYDGKRPPKLLEYNADTPTSLLESSVAQWFWLEDRSKEGRGEQGFDQFNSIHEALIERWRTVLGKPGGWIHFACHQDSPEDFGTTEYLRDTCIQAGWKTETLDMSEIGFDGTQFIDRADRVIDRMFKLYPWEWLFAEEFGAHLGGSRTLWLEPPWKRLLADKAILPWLWQRHPGHPNLLPASFDRSAINDEVVFKPCLEREGQGVLMLPTGTAPLDSPRGIYQASQRLPTFDGRHALIGTWVIGDVACGLGMREDQHAITRNTSRFVPHRFR